MHHSRLRTLLVTAGVTLTVSSGWAVEFTAFQNYTSFASSPYPTGPSSYFHLEDFEDGALNTPGISATAGQVLNPGSLTDSVDGDDGVIDGFGNNGRSSYSSGNTSLTFLFDSVALGGVLPTQVGLVVTDIGFLLGTQIIGGDVQVIFEVFGPGGVSLGILDDIYPFDTLPGGQTAEDLFLGASDAGGISKMVVTVPNSNDWEIDHVQYGAVTIPDAGSTGLLLAAGLGGLVAWRRRQA